MKTTLRIKNFKSLEDVQLELKRTLLLLGPNGAGKSSIFKLLKFLERNILTDENYTHKKTIYSIDDKADLGSFSEIVTNNDLNRKIIIELNYDSSYDEFKTKIKRMSSRKIDLGSNFNEQLKKEKEEKKRYRSKLSDGERLKLELVEFLSNNYLFGNELETNFKGNLNSGEIKKFLAVLIVANDRKDKDIMQETCDDLKVIVFITDYIDATTDISDWIFQSIWQSSYKLREKYIENLKFKFRLEFEFRDSGYNLCLVELIDSDTGAVLSYSLDQDGNQIPTLNHNPLFIKEEFSPLSSKCNELFTHNNFNDGIKKEFLYNLIKKIDNITELDKNALLYTGAGKNEFLERVLIQVVKFYEIFPDIIKKFLILDHMPSMREIPQRQYRITDGKNSKSFYEYYSGFIPKKENVSALLQIVDAGNKLKFEGEIDNPDEYIVTSARIELLKTLRDLNLAKSIYLYSEEAGNQIMIETFSGAVINLSEASSGLIQLLPILLSSFFIPFDDENFPCIFIEQPELHLHPKLQASLAKIVSAKNDPYIIYPSFIIETHSEHLIRKIQVLVAKGEIAKDSIGIFYFDNKKGLTSIKEMEMEDNGFFKEPWPDGFFDDSYNLSRDLIYARKN